MNEDLKMDSNPLIAPDEESIRSFHLAEMLPLQGNITPEIIETIEADLELYEKVAMVFLIYESIPLALQRLKVAEALHRSGRPSTGLLSDWARSAQQGSTRNWESKLLEALCIVQNYLVVEKLGYIKQDVIDRYLPHNPDMSCGINLMRKALYNVCEMLTEEEGKKLVYLVNEDVESRPLPFARLDSDFLEVHFLNWIVNGYINLNSTAEVNVSNVLKNLKVLEKYGMLNTLESIAGRYQRIGSEDDDEAGYMDTQSIRSFGTSDTNGTNEDVTITSKTKCYPINPNNIGVVVIINQKNFYKEPNQNLKDLLSAKELECRVGTDIDRDRLSEAFGSFGFTVHIWEDLDHMQLIQCIEEATRNIVQENHSCFVLCILSHGVKDAVYGVNSIPVYIDDIHAKLNGKFCPKLIHKPKVLIIQACQGHNLSEAVVVPNSDVAADGPSSPKKCSHLSDTLISTSTVPGYVSFRHKVKGSWFIQTLCDELLAATSTVNIMDVLTDVSAKLANKYTTIDNICTTMQPQFTSRLTKKLELPLNAAARKKVAEMILKRRLFENLVDEYLRREFQRQGNSEGSILNVD